MDIEDKAAMAKKPPEGTLIPPAVVLGESEEKQEVEVKNPFSLPRRAMVNGRQVSISKSTSGPATLCNPFYS